MRLLDDPAVIGHSAAGLGVLQQDAEERPLREPCAVIAHLHLDADGVCAGLHHRDGLRQAGVGDKEAVAAVLGDAVAHVHGLRRRRGLVEQRGVGAGEAGEVHHHGLEVEQRFQSALRDFRLIGRIGGVPTWILQDVALDDGRRDRVVVAEADHGARDAVAPSKLCQRRQHVSLGAAFRKVFRNRSADRFRHSGIHERVEGFVAHGYPAWPPDRPRVGRYAGRRRHPPAPEPSMNRRVPSSRSLPPRRRAPAYSCRVPLTPCCRRLRRPA